MLRLSASYSKKIPVRGQEFSSQSCHAGVEVEIPDGLPEEALRERIRETFKLVRASVETELAAAGAPAAAEPAQDGEHDDPRPEPADAAPRSGGGTRATDRQLRFLRDLAARGGLDPGDLDDLAAERFGVRDTAGLTRLQASALIDSMNAEAAEAARRAAA
jgi:hypothetical protein